MTTARTAPPVAPHRLAARIAAVLAIDPAAPAIEYENSWITWGQLARLAEQIGRLATSTAGAAPRVGVLLRNTPAHVAAFLGILLASGRVVVINPSRGDDRTRADIEALDLPVVIGTADDLAALVPEGVRAARITLADVDGEPAVEPASPAGGAATATTTDTGAQIAVHMLTSGTTGPPKRVELSYDMLAHAVLGDERDSGGHPARLSSGVAIVNAPLVHIGGVYRVLQCIVAARAFVLLPRFDLESWARAVRTHRPRAVSLVPAAVRMVLHSDLTREDLSSLSVVTSGTAPLSAEDADAFTEKFGVPVLTSYAATEFGGGVAGWTLADHREFWSTKRGSVGRANPGARLRIVDEAGVPQPADTVGLIEVSPAHSGGEWTRTTDLGRLDSDGFLWVLGRADQAIIRGGFKIIPDDVRDAVEAHPAVAGAAVVGRPDTRLGETPVVMVEPLVAETLSESDLLEFLSGRLAPYEVPTAIAIVESLPRTPSGKPDLAAVRAHFAEEHPTATGPNTPSAAREETAPR